MSSNDTRERLAQSIMENPRLSAAILFGSAARGIDGPHSDLDVAIFTEADFQAEELIDLKDRASRATAREVDMVCVKSDLSYILQNEIAVYGKVLFSRPATIAETCFLKTPQIYSDFIRVRRPLEEEYVRRKLQ